MQTKKPWRLGTRAKLLLRGLRYAPLLPFVSIDGWLTIDEAITLYELSRALPNEKPLAVEIGSWQGKSSVCLASGLAGKFRPRLCCIDPFDASGDSASVGVYGVRAEQAKGGLRATFEANLAEAGLLDVIEVHAGFSHDEARHFAEPIDLLFVDGDHAYAAVKQDFLDWAPKVRSGGYLVMHDVVHREHEGPRRVVEELVRADPTWVDCRYVDSMFVARKAMA
jgi:hypothetical protein